MSNGVQPKVTIEISHKDQFKDSFFERCVGQAVRDQRLVEKLPDWLPYHLNSITNPTTFMVWYYEDKTLKEMRTKSGAAYQKLFGDMKWIADTLQCNVTVFLGHLEICENYVQTTYKSSLEQANQSQFALPTIFLIIACYTDRLATKYNTDPVFVEKKIAFFGFEDFMHIHEGEIYGCKSVHKAPPSMECGYDTVRKDLESLLEIDKNGAKKTVNNVRQKRLNIENPLVKCCEAKEGAMYDLFIKYLDQRSCVKFTKEKLVEKFRPFATNPQDRSLLISPKATLQAIDGIACKDGSCAIPNPYVEAAKQSKKFNDMSNKRLLYEIILGSWKEGLFYFSQKIKTIKPADGGIFTYKYEDKIPILALLLENKRNYDVKEIYTIFLGILKTYGKDLKFDVTYGERAETLLHTIRKSKIPEGKQYFLYKKIYEIVRPEEREALFFQTNDYKQTPLETDINLGKKLPLLILLFYIEQFGAKVRDIQCFITVGFRGNLLHGLFLYPIESYGGEYYEYAINKNDHNLNIDLNTNEKVFFTCVKGLLDLGVDPNAGLKKVLANNRYELGKEELDFLQSLKPLHLHLYLYKPAHDAEKLIKLFLSYGMTNTDKYFSKQYNFYAKQIQTPETFETYIRSLKILHNVIANDAVGVSKYNFLVFPNNNFFRVTNNSIVGKSFMLNELEDTTLYMKSFSKLSPYIVKNLKKYIRSLSYDDGIELAKGNVSVFKECLLFFAIQKRKNYKERIAKTRKNSKTNFNTTMKKYTSNLNLLYNIDRLLRTRMKEIEEFIKYGTFTKEQKATHRKNTLEYRQMNLPPKAIYNALGDHLKFLEKLSMLNKEINKVRKDIEEGISRINDEEMKATFRRQVEAILENDEDYTTEEKLEGIKEELEKINQWLSIQEMDVLRQNINGKLNAMSNANNRKQRYKNVIKALVENDSISAQQYVEELQRILREISV
jgi:hypothetical protein